MKKIVPVDKIREINVGDSVVEFLYESGVYQYTAENIDSIQELYSVYIEPFIGDVDVYAWVFDELLPFPMVIINHTNE